MYNKQIGIAAEYTCAIVVSSGAVAFMANSPNPKGGEIIPTSMFTSSRVANQSISKPRACAIGTKIGSVINMIETGSMNVPITRTMSCIAIKIMRVEASSPLTNRTSWFAAPVKARIWLKAAEPATKKSMVLCIT